MIKKEKKKHTNTTFSACSMSKLISNVPLEFLHQINYAHLNQSVKHGTESNIQFYILYLFTHNFYLKKACLLYLTRKEFIFEQILK